MEGAGLVLPRGFLELPLTAELVDGGDTALFLLQTAIPLVPLLGTHGLPAKDLGQRLFR